MRRTPIAAVLALAAATLCGCGTIGNCCKDWDKMRIYGGVLGDYGGAKAWISARSASPTVGIQQTTGTVVGVGLVALDGTLCLFTDTLTLPLTIPAAIWGRPSSSATTDGGCACPPAAPPLSPASVPPPPAAPVPPPPAAPVPPLPR